MLLITYPLVIDCPSITHWLHYISRLLFWPIWFIITDFTRTVREWFQTIKKKKRKKGIVHARLNGESNWFHKNPRLVSRSLQCMGHLWEKRNSMYHIYLTGGQVTEKKMFRRLSCLSLSLALHTVVISQISLHHDTRKRESATRERERARKEHTCSKVFIS